jgi:hypothetical protein
MFIITNKKILRYYLRILFYKQTWSNFKTIRLTHTNDFFVKITKKYDKLVILKIFLKIVA